MVLSSDKNSLGLGSESNPREEKNPNPAWQINSPYFPFIVDSNCLFFLFCFITQKNKKIIGANYWKVRKPKEKNIKKYKKVGNITKQPFAECVTFGRGSLVYMF